MKTAKATIVYGRGLPTESTYNPKFPDLKKEILVYKNNGYYFAYEEDFLLSLSPSEGLLTMDRVKASNCIPLVIYKSKNIKSTKRLVDVNIKNI